MSNPNEYKGWSNFATWRVHLEMFDGMDPAFISAFERCPYNLSQMLRENAREHIDETSNGIARDWAFAFMSDANFNEIAKAMLEAFPAHDQDEDEDQ